MKHGDCEALTKSPENAKLEGVIARALEFVTEGAKIGLGSGRASCAFVQALGQRVASGLHVQGVPTSETTSQLATSLNIPLIQLTEDVILDLTVDGADEVAPNLDLIKGWGGALVRERIVAAASSQQIIIVGPEKLVQTLGQRGRIPVEVIPLGLGYVLRKLKEIGLVPALRLTPDASQPALSDNGNNIVDCALKSPLLDGAAARKLEARILEIAGVVDTGMFLGTCSRVLVAKSDGSFSLMERKANY